jgi:hypothetical protein
MSLGADMPAPYSGDLRERVTAAEGLRPDRPPGGLKVVQGMPAEDAVKWAHQELVKIYA